MAKKLGEHERYKIEEVGEDGEPIAPARHAKIFTRQCGVIVRDNVPITTQEWHQPKQARSGVTYVDGRTKEMLWTKLAIRGFHPTARGGPR